MASHCHESEAYEREGGYEHIGTRGGQNDERGHGMQQRQVEDV